MIRRPGRRSACAAAIVLLAALVLVLVLALPAFAGAETGEGGGLFGPLPAREEGAYLGSFANTPQEALAHWTKVRRELAEPLSVITLPGSPPEGAGGGGEDTDDDAHTTTAPQTTAAVLDAGSAETSGAQTGAVQGIEVDAAESTLFPDRANGKIYGEYRIGSERELYECSGSVVGSPLGNVILTAGHCVVDPETGALARFLIFIPAYREEAEPYGTWAVKKYAITETWKATAGKAVANEGGDVALLTLEKNSEGTNVEQAVGALGIAFDQPCNQAYTQYGYPAAAPYNGEILYSHPAAYAGPDTNPSFSPEPMKIASDFTQGASGGPWTIGATSAPTALSVTAYGYASQPGFLYGPYLGEGARHAYELAAGATVAPGTEEVCKPPPVTAPAPAPAAPVITPPPAPHKRVTLKVKRIRRRADGSAVVIAKVGTAGKLKLTGSAVHRDALSAPDAGNYHLVVAAKGAAGRRLRRIGGAKVGVKIVFASSGTTRRISRSIRLSRRSPARRGVR